MVTLIFPSVAKVETFTTMNQPVIYAFLVSTIDRKASKLSWVDFWFLLYVSIFW